MNPTEHQGDGQHNEGYAPDPSGPTTGGAAAAGGRLPPLPEIGSVRGTASGPEFESQSMGKFAANTRDYKHADERDKRGRLITLMSGRQRQ